MRLIQDGARLRRAVSALRKRAGRVALVPTMGGIHAGHLSLLDVARRHAEVVVASIFVNPIQFERPHDFERYPRTLERDRELLSGGKADILFAPDEAVMYPNGVARPEALVEVGGPAEGLEGAHREGHFRGVATVVVKLLNLVQPTVVVFGQKDYQQLQVIKSMVRELLLPTTIVEAPTLRESDGLAMSSRNLQLDEDQRKLAPKLYQHLCSVAERILKGEIDHGFLERDCERALVRDDFRVDYVAVRSLDLKLPRADDGALVVLGAAWLGQTRLIDNVIVQTA